MVQAMHLPCDLKEEFEKVEFRGGSRDERGFLIRSGIAGQKERFYQVGGKRVDLHAERESGCPRKCGVQRVPDLVYVDGLLQNGNI